MTTSSLSRTAALAAALLLATTASIALAADDAKRDEWVQKYEEQKASTAQLEAELSQAKVDYSRGRSTKHLRGKGKAGLIEEIQRLEKEVAQAQVDLQNFPDEAMRQGALPGWFRDVDDDAPAAQDASAAKNRARQGRGAKSESLSGRGAKQRQTQEAPPEAEASDDDSSSRSMSSSRAKEREKRRLDR